MAELGRGDIRRSQSSREWIEFGAQHIAITVGITVRGVEDRYDLLTPREKEILHLLLEGKTNKDIAAALALSLYTVETHRRNLQSKLNIHSFPELILYAARKGIME
jgi:DNA-binding NarL/FixJ family response regulator